MSIIFQARLGHSLILIGLSSQEESVQLNSALQEIICFLVRPPCITLLNISHDKTETNILENLSCELFK